MTPPDDRYLVYQVVGSITIHWYAVCILGGAVLGATQRIVTVDRNQRPMGHREDDRTQHRWPCAACYDALVAPLNRTRVGRWRHDLVGALAGDILEIGVGTGLNLRSYGPAARITAIDPNATLLAAARPRAHARGYQVGQATAQALPFATATFDVAVSTLVFCTIPDPVVALAELRRVLRPGGTLVLLEHTCTGRPLPDRVLAWVTPAWSRIAGGCQLNRDTAGLLEREGWELCRHERRMGGLIRLLKARVRSAPTEGGAPQPW